ncbi:contractile injection system protein, VgrG/Pvc8 family [Gracilibacillus sp. YIM 98692]|uniref:phage late control D family protein n=1 Tax=Gracilibacillus sp. YIM 98692 TaxID=2663532 RepID=UPI0013CF61A1|nr:contractile injection system protein, VgrG/Pvc8 family [Gracilibacillus sp. YIM 98692]
MQSRKSFVEVEYQGVDITDDVQKDLLDFEYTDNASGDSDSVRLSMKDEKKIWLKHWFPEKGDVVLPMIKTRNWRRNDDQQHLNCGRFFVDEPSYDGRPGSFTLDAISSPLNSNFSDVGRSKMWENITLQQIASDIANKADLQLQFLSESNPLYDKKEQSETDDSSFLSELCNEEGLAMKVTDKKIVIFDEKDFEERESIATYHEWGDVVRSYSFKTSLTNTSYDGVEVKYYDPEKGKVIEFLHSISDGDKIYKVNKRVKTGQEARRLAQKTLRRLNRKETTGELTVIGNIELLGATCINLEGFGAFDGKYFVEKATHSIGNGYTTDIEIRKVLEGY